MTLGIGSGNGKSLPRRHRESPTSLLPRSEDLLAATGACPRCRRALIGYRFTTSDGLPITAFHCAEHGDVIPMQGVIVRDE